MAKAELGATLIVTRSRPMHNARVPSLTTLGPVPAAGAAFVGAGGGTARADERRPGAAAARSPGDPDGASRRFGASSVRAEPVAESLLPTGDLEPDAWDIP